MKKTIVLIIILIITSILLFVIFTRADDQKLTESEALEIGEEKYLEFLWMVDGAFNSERFVGEFNVNGKVLSDTNKKFTCTYKNKKDNSCIGNNFPMEFKRIFSSDISYNEVYGDGSFDTWFKYEKGKYIFTNMNNCSTNRMKLNQSISVQNIDKDKLTFNVSSNDVGNENSLIRMFVLIKENDDWKISRVYYHDVCEMDYYIG